MSELYEAKRYFDAKKNAKELEPILKSLDDVCDILYNNLGHSGVFRLLEHAEDVRIDYYIRHYEYQQIVKNKGKVVYE